MPDEHGQRHHPAHGKRADQDDNRIDKRAHDFLSEFSLFFYLGDIVRVGAAAFSLQTRFVDLVVFLPSITSLLVFYLYLRYYRRFSWYPSGKLGFIGGGFASLYFTLRALVDFYLFWVLSFSSLIFDSVLSLLVSAVFAGIVYLRSGRAGAYRIIEIFRFKKRTSFRN